MICPNLDKPEKNLPRMTRIARIEAVYMILLNGFYEDNDTNRQEEFLACLRRNVVNQQINEIHLFVEQPCRVDRLLSKYPSLAADKIRLVEHGRRLTYNDLFTYANTRLGGRRVIIANADIYFDDTLAALEDYDLSGKLLCLSRWDVQADGSACHFAHPSSQDAWIFQTPLREFSCAFHLGVLGCDNRLAWEAERVGLALSNPSRTIRAYHLHLSQVRRYNGRSRLRGPSKAVPPALLFTPCARVAFRETMGYSTARLEIGTSSHNNEVRPFTTIPQPLLGLPYTQVVSCVVSPVEVEFITTGKLFVLVGNDWYGHQLATAWLGQTGLREALPLVETALGTGFEVWSISGNAGDCFIIPTQVMLVAASLVQKSTGNSAFELV